MLTWAGNHLASIAFAFTLCTTALFGLALVAWQPEIIMAGLVAAIVAASLLLAELVRS